MFCVMEDRPWQFQKLFMKMFNLIYNSLPHRDYTIILHNKQKHGGTNVIKLQISINNFMFPYLYV